MSLSRYAPQLGQALRLPIERPAAFALIAAPWLVVLIVSRALGHNELASLGLDALALGGFGVNWQRFALNPGECSWRSVLAFGPRHLLWGIVLQIFSYFESVPALLLSLAMQDSPDLLALSLSLKQVFQFLIGGMLLMLPHIALKVQGDGTTALQSMVLKGGLAVGLGYVLTQLPFVFLAQSLSSFAESGDLPQAILVAGFALMTQLNVTITAGYYAFVWQELRSSKDIRTPPV